MIRPPAVPRRKNPVPTRKSELERMEVIVRDLEMQRERAAAFVYDAGASYRRACDAVEQGRESLARIRDRVEMPPTAAHAKGPS
jgi:hypothetical protein